MAGPSDGVEVTNGRKKTSGGGRWEKYKERPARAGVRWADVPAGAIGECVAAVCAVGDALLFGTTSDGGSLVLVICSGQQRYKRYATSVQEAIETLADVENTASEMH